MLLSRCAGAKMEDTARRKGEWTYRWMGKTDRQRADRHIFNVSQFQEFWKRNVRNFVFVIFILGFFFLLFIIVFAVCVLFAAAVVDVVFVVVILLLVVVFFLSKFHLQFRCMVV